MKTRLCISLGLFLFLLSTQACQKSSREVTDELLQSIAEDEDYIAYRASLHQASFHVGSRSWDQEALSAFREKHPEVESYCMYPEDELASIRGGVIWKETFCAVSSGKKKVREKFRSQHLTDEDWAKVMAYYNEARGKKEVREISKAIIVQR